MKKWILGIVGLLVLTLVSGVAAHDTWVGRTAAGWEVLRGHDGVGGDPYNPAYVKEARAYDASGGKVPVIIQPAGNKALLLPAKEPALVTIVYHSGAWVKTPEGWKNVSKREAKGEILEAVKGTFYSKNLFQWHDSFARPLGEVMEIVPLRNPLTLKAGDSLPVQVLYHGRPLAGLSLSTGSHGPAAAVTDSQGRASITLPQAGLVIIAGNLRTPLPNDPEADQHSETVNLTFAVK